MDTSTKMAVIIIKNILGKFWVHQRSENKKMFPNLYGLGAGGHVKEGEDKYAAAKRELLEETGLMTELKYLFKIKFKNNEVNHLVEVFETISDRNEIANPDEWQWSGWMEEGDVDSLLEGNKLCPDTAIFYKKYRKLN